jgi:hypothetical protein
MPQTPSQSQRFVLVVGRLDQFIQADPECAEAVQEALEPCFEDAHLDVGAVTERPQPAQLRSLLANLGRAASDDEDVAEILSESLDAALDTLAENDFFGTERQSDPRGDGRDDDYSLWFVQGVDDQQFEPGANRPVGQEGFLITDLTEEQFEVSLDGQSLGCFTHDDLGWAGMDIVRSLVEDIAQVRAIALREA